MSLESVGRSGRFSMSSNQLIVDKVRSAVLDNRRALTNWVSDLVRYNPF
jgi:hypothetical protein